MRFNFLFCDKEEVALRTNVIKIIYGLIALRFQRFYSGRLIAQFYSFNHRWAQIVFLLISDANIFVHGLAVLLTFKNLHGLVIKANFFSQSTKKK